MTSFDVPDSWYCLCIVKVADSYWIDNKGALHAKRAIIPQKRLSNDKVQPDFIAEECAQIGATAFQEHITNLHSVRPGLYSLMMVSSCHDPEDGEMIDYDLKLVDVMETKSMV